MRRLSGVSSSTRGTSYFGSLFPRWRVGAERYAYILNAVGHACARSVIYRPCEGGVYANGISASKASPPSCRPNSRFFLELLKDIPSSERGRRKRRSGVAGRGGGETAASAHFLFASDLPSPLRSHSFSSSLLSSPSTRALRFAPAPSPVRFRCLFPFLALESLEIEIRFSRQYFAGPPTDRGASERGPTGMCSASIQIANFFKSYPERFDRNFL